MMHTAHHAPRVSAIDLAGTLLDFAHHKARRGCPPEIAIAAMAIVDDMRGGTTPPADIIARCRAHVILGRAQGQMILASYLELIADRLEYERKH